MQQILNISTDLNFYISFVIFGSILPSIFLYKCCLNKHFPPRDSMSLFSQSSKWRISLCFANERIRKITGCQLSRFYTV